jgi:hypothetical protein
MACRYDFPRPGLSRPGRPHSRDKKGCLKAVIDLELVKYIGEMSLDRFFADKTFLPISLVRLETNLRISFPVRQHIDDIIIERFPANSFN